MHIITKEHNWRRNTVTDDLIINTLEGPVIGSEAIEVEGDIGEFITKQTRELKRKNEITTMIVKVSKSTEGTIKFKYLTQ